MSQVNYLTNTDQEQVQMSRKRPRSFKTKIYTSPKKVCMDSDNEQEMTNTQSSSQFWYCDNKITSF